MKFDKKLPNLGKQYKAKPDAKATLPEGLLPDPRNRHISILDVEALLTAFPVWWMDLPAKVLLSKLSDLADQFPNNQV